MLAWYDNEWGYANRLVELARAVARTAVEVTSMAGAATATAPPASADLRNYILVTAAYWVETLADGATRMLVLFYFYELGYSAFTVASLFIFYEIFGIVTNLVGGWLAARFGLRTTLFMGLGTQVFATAMVGFVPEAWLVVPYVMVSQAFSGIAKDLTKMSSKSAVKLVVPEGDEGSLYRWVAVLTGSKNALKGVGFFLGAAMLTVMGFQTSMLVLAGVGPGDADRRRRADARPPRQARREGEVQADVLQQPRRQRARRGADLPLRPPRRLVRRRPAGLPRDGPRLELPRHRRLPRDLGDRLRGRPGGRAALHPRPRRPGRASRRAARRPGSPSSSPPSRPRSRSRWPPASTRPP